MDADRPPWRRLALVTSPVLLVVVAVLIGEVLASDPPSTGVLIADAIVGVGACAALPAVWRRPVRGAVVLVALSALVPTVTPVAATAVLWVARRERVGVAAMLAVAAVLAQGLRGWWRPDLGLPTGWWLLVVAASYAALVGWGAWAQVRHDLLTSRMEAVRQAERARIAREVHDTLGHRLSLVATLAGALEYNTAAPPEQVAEATSSLRAAAHGALEDLREVIGVLRVDLADQREAPERPQPSLIDLDALVDEGRRTGVTIAVTVDVAAEDRAALPAGVGRTAYRIVQEALTNARKHAPGEAVRIVVRGRPGHGLEVEVTNPVPSGGRSGGLPGAGTGMVGLRERVELLGGRFAHGPSPSGRYHTTASLPWPM